MIPKRPVGGVPVSGFDRLNDCRMLFQCAAWPPFRFERGGRQKRHRAVNQIELPHQEPIVRCEVDLMVKAPVRTAKRIRIADQRMIGLEHIPKHPDLFGRRVPGRKPGSQALKLPPDDIELRQLIMVQRCDNQGSAIARQE